MNIYNTCTVASILTVLYNCRHGKCLLRSQNNIFSYLLIKALIKTSNDSKLLKVSIGVVSSQ